MTQPSIRNEQDHDIHGKPGMSLLYLAFVFLPLLFWPKWSASTLTASVAAIALFLPVYFAWFRSGPRMRMGLVLVVAGIGYGLIPFNPGGNTFIIYAFALAASAFPARQAIIASLLMWLAMALEFWWVMPWLNLALAYVGMVAVIGTMIVSDILYSRARWRRDAELRLTQDEVRRLAAMAERERIGRDLHDVLGHTLSLVALKSELAGKLIERDPLAARQQIREVEAVARQALAQVREAVAGIRSAGLEAELASARLVLLSADIRLDQALAPLALDERVEGALAMAVREAVTNILRHSGARRVEVELREDAQGLCLQIADDGRGGVVVKGNGLVGMGERLQAVGGTLEIDSAAGAGTRLCLRVPRRASAGVSP